MADSYPPTIGILQALINASADQQPKPTYNTDVYIPQPIQAPWAVIPSIQGFAGGGHIGDMTPYVRFSQPAYAGGGRASSGYVQGPGDGKSDSVPAVAPNGALSALSDGEFVVSAPAVSNLGHGSNNAGARKLDMAHRAWIRGDMSGALSALAQSPKRRK